MHFAASRSQSVRSLQSELHAPFLSRSLQSRRNATRMSLPSRFFQRRRRPAAGGTSQAAPRRNIRLDPERTSVGSDFRGANNMNRKIPLHGRVVLHTVSAFILVILVVQLWLFTVSLDAMEVRSASTQAVIAAVLFSLLACGAIWALIRLFLRAEGE